MEIISLDKRLHYIDHLRGFMFIVMAIDHALHAYAYRWKNFWFFRDYQGSELLDAFYLQDQVIIMPMLFFIFGMFVLSSLKRRGFWGYLVERFLRFTPLYIIGVIFIVPLLSYPRYETYDEPNIGYFEYWKDVFLTTRIQAGPFWVLHALVGMTLILLFIYYVLPFLYRWIVKGMRFCVDHPIPGFIIFGLLSSILLGVSDLLWGAPWWVNFGYIFSMQGSRMLLILLYFIAGSALVQAGIFQNQNLMDKIGRYWPLFLGLYIIFAIPFMVYSTVWHDMAFNDTFYRISRSHGGWISGWSENWAQISPIFWNIAPGILLKTTLFGFLCLSQALFLVSIFKRFFSQPTAWWTSLARNGFGIFIVHETIVVWTQYFLLDVQISVFLKFLISAVLGITLAWLISAKILLKIPIVKRLISPDSQVA